ncbi:FAD-dependent thymidylate synthase [Candidatus Saccharibacteria bacterium]|nr:FAD-dependent thymidylate synthase [Candidatus Saccharibacteria bacterium]
MDVRVIGSTKPGYVLPVEEAKIFAGRSAGICYMEDKFETIESWKDARALKLFEGIGKSGHHSVAGHTSYNLLLTGVPKIIAMILNNEKKYDTSEKSARYTTMVTEGDELRLYSKWFALLYELLRGKYYKLGDKTIEKLAKENARYFISVFTPATTMEYTVDLRQGNYLIQFLEEYAEKISESEDPFDVKLYPWLIETAGLFRSVFNCDEIRDKKWRGLSLFASNPRSEYYGDVYSTNYVGSFAQLAQAQRHRTLSYEMTVPKLRDATFFVPPILRDQSVLPDRYLKDIESIKGNYPQGMQVFINERGTLENFALKCSERLCGAAQLEICLQTKKTLENYLAKASIYGETNALNVLNRIIGKTKCQFTKQECLRPCPLGPAEAFTRKI